MINQHSLEAWGRIQKALPEKRFRVLSTIAKLDRPTALEVSRYLGLPINSITGRISELKKQGMIEGYGEKIVSGYTHARYRITDREDPKPLPKEKRQSKETLLKDYRDAILADGDLGLANGMWSDVADILEKEILSRMR